MIHLLVLAQAAGQPRSFINHIDNYWLVLILKAAMVIVFFLVAPLAVGYMEHKVLAHMQARLGPMEAGRFHGWAQLIADGVKFVQKEDVIPAAADSWVFTLAPGIVMIPYILIFAVILGWLQDEGYEVHCVYVDLGQPCEDREAILKKARAPRGPSFFRRSGATVELGDAA